MKIPTVHPEVREVPLGKGVVTFIDEDDWEIIEDFDWRAMSYRGGRYLYAATSARAKKVLLLHRLLLDAAEGLWVDHINHNTLDNRRSNLRIGTPSQNLMNRRKCIAPCSSRFKGVSALGKYGWRAQIKADHKRHHIGVFRTETEAAVAFDEWARRLHGEFACLNFPAGPPR